VGFRRSSRLFSVAGLTTASLFLSSCIKDAPQDTFSPDGPSARRVFGLAKPVFIIAGIVGVGVYAVIALCIVKFRRRDDLHVPVQVHGNTKLELLWGAIPAVLLAVVGVFSVGEIFKQAEVPKDAINVTVIGHQWWWEYHYAPVGQSQLDPKLVTIDDPADLDAAELAGRAPRKLANVVKEAGPVIVTANELHVPAGRSVRLSLTSTNVMHNWWVPKLAGKLYAIPGKINHLNLDSDPEDAGKTFYGQCAEFCGTSHANMRFKVKVDSPADYEAWLADQAAPAVEPTTEASKAGKVLFEGSGGCSTCHWLNSSKTNEFEIEKDAEGKDAIVKKIGPNLTHIGGRAHFAGAIAELNTTNLKAWIRNPQKFKPGSKMVVRKFNEDEVNSLVAYVESLK
jgi:cytochrome c oxidase subunit II